MAWWDERFQEMEALRRELMRAFDDTPLRRPYSRVSFLPGLRARAYPLVNITEDENTLYIEALAPGLDPESIKISMANNQLTLSGEKRSLNGDIKAEAYHRSERAAGRFVRNISLPTPVDADKIKADYRDGLMLIRLPKAEAAKTRQIEIQVS